MFCLPATSLIYIRSSGNVLWGRNKVKHRLNQLQNWKDQCWKEAANLEM